MYTYDAKVWALSIVQGPFFVNPCQTLNVTIRNFSIAVSASKRWQHFVRKIAENGIKFKGSQGPLLRVSIEAIFPHENAGDTWCD
jgi:hypothetical protein